jgi:hypothetical protein
MKVVQISEAELPAWRSLVDSHRALVASRVAVLRQGVADALVRAALVNPAERAAALSIIPCLDELRQKSLFPEQLALVSCANGFTEEAISLIATLPRSWVLENPERHAGPLLEQESYEEYRMIPSIHDKLCAFERERQLAVYALGDADPDIQKAGEDSMTRLTTRTGSDIV